jgi:hypothetical protein
LGKASRQHKADVIAGKVASFASKNPKQFIDSLKDPYQTIKDSLLSGKTVKGITPEQAKQDFKTRTLAGLQKEALTYLAKYGDKEIACNQLLKTIVSDNKYMDLIAVVGLNESVLKQHIKETLDKK